MTTKKPMPDDEQPDPLELKRKPKPPNMPRKPERKKK
jgi:hypothetical protein